MFTRRRFQTAGALIAMVLLSAMSTVIADEADRIEPCDADTTAVAQAVVDYLIAEASPAFQMHDAVDSGTVYVYRTTYRSACVLDGLSHDAVQIVYTDEERHNDLARNLGGVSALVITSVDFLDTGVADVYVAAILRIARAGYIDSSLGCGKRLYLSKSDGVWKVDDDRGAICS